MEVLPMIVAGLAVFAIILTFLILSLHFVLKVKPKTKDEAVKLLILKYPMSILFVSLIILTMVVTTTRDKEIKVEDNMDSIISDTNSMLETAKLRLSNVSVDPLTTKKDDFQKKYDKEIYRSAREKTGFQELLYKCYAYIDLIFATESKVEAFDKWVSSINLCSESGDIYVTYDNITRLADEVRTFYTEDGQGNPFVFTTLFMFSKVNESLFEQMKEQLNLDVGNNLTNIYLESIKGMTNHFQTDVRNSESTRDKWNQRMIESLPTFSTQVIVSTIITATCTIFYIVSPMSIFSTGHKEFLGEQLFAQCVLISFYVNGALNIVISIVVVILSIGVIGNVDCILEKDTFGVWNFTKPFVFDNNQFAICAMSNSKFYKSLENDTLVKSGTIIQSIKIEEYKRKLMEIVKSSDIALQIPAVFYQKVPLIEKSWKQIEDDLKKTCLNADHETNLSIYRQDLRHFLDETLEFRTHAEKVKDKIGQREVIFSSIFDKFYEQREHSIKSSLAGVLKEINSTDFPCDSIIANYAKIGPSICKQFDHPLEKYWVYIIITITTCLLFLIIQFIVYRNLQGAVDHETAAKGNQNSTTIPGSTQSITTAV